MTALISFLVEGLFIGFVARAVGPQSLGLFAGSMVGGIGGFAGGILGGVADSYQALLSVMPSSLVCAGVGAVALLIIVRLVRGRTALTFAHRVPRPRHAPRPRWRDEVSDSGA